MSTSYPDLSKTVFPESIDSFGTAVDITASDGKYVQQYQEAMKEGNTELARNVLSLIPNNANKIINATRLNKITDAILAVERFYKTDVQPYITQKQAEWQGKVNDMGYIGTYSSSGTYKQNNIVQYTSGGVTNLYIATQDVPTGTAPTNTTYWRVFTVRGAIGPAGEKGDTFALQGDYSATKAYTPGDCVLYDGALWQNKQASTGQTPAEGSAYWNKLISSDVTTYPLQADQPTGQVQGELWFQLI